MTVEVYKTKDSAITVIEKGKGFYVNGTKMIKKGDKLLREIKGKDWNSCMKQHHKLMGWEPYKPF